MDLLGAGAGLNVAEFHFTLEVKNASAFKFDALSIQPANDLTTAP